MKKEKKSSNVVKLSDGSKKAVQKKKVKKQLGVTTNVNAAVDTLGEVFDDLFGHFFAPDEMPEAPKPTKPADIVEFKPKEK